MRRLLEVILNAEGTVGGEQRHVLQILDGLDPERFEAEVLTWSIPAFAEEMASRGVPSESVSAPRILDWRLLRHIESRVREGHFDLVHAHGHRAGLIGRLGAIRAGTPHVVWTCHLAENKADRNPVVRRGYSAAMRYLDARTDATIAVSAFLGDWLVSQGVGASGIDVIPNGVDCSVFKPMGRDAELAESLGLDPNAPILGTIARLTEQKGVGSLIAAMAVIGRAMPTAQCLVVGSGPLESELKTLAEQSGARVVFAGERPDVPELLGLLDVAVVASLWEGAFCYSLLEALASGTPVVCSDIEVFTGVVESGENATVFPAGDSAGLADAVLTLLGDPKRAQRIAESGRALASARFSAERASQATIAVYERLLGGERP